MYSLNKFAFCNIFCRSVFGHRKLLISVLYCSNREGGGGMFLFSNSSLQSVVYLLLIVQVASSKVVIDDIP